MDRPQEYNRTGPLAWGGIHFGRMRLVAVGTEQITPPLPGNQAGPILGSAFLDLLARRMRLERLPDRDMYSVTIRRAGKVEP